jgi:ClpP class serine protease
VVVTPSGEVGSIGVYAAHEDISGMLEQDGVKVTLVSAGKYKTEGNPFEPLSDEAREYIQGRVDEYAAMFHRAVAAGRGVAVERVRSEFGEGRVFGAQEGVSRGLADRVGTLDETIRKASRRPPASPQERAAAGTDGRLAALERLRTL